MEAGRPGWGRHASTGEACPRATWEGHASFMGAPGSRSEAGWGMKSVTEMRPLQTRWGRARGPQVATASSSRAC